MSDKPVKRGPGRPRKPKPDNVPPKRAAHRPKDPKVQLRQMTVREYAMGYVFEALDTWAEIMKDTDQPGTARAAAAAHIVNRAVGQPAQAIAQEGDTVDKAITGIKIEFAEAPKGGTGKKSEGE